MRLDKYLTECFIGTRSEVKKIINKKEIIVNGKVITNESFDVNPINDVVTYKDKIVNYQKNHYFILNKPSGYITSTKDNINKVVMELFNDLPKMLVEKLFPVGRLDKDTEGLLIITDDGEFAHKITSPNHNLNKTYYVEYEGKLNENAQEILTKPIELNDGTIFKEATIFNITNNSCYITISEGQYHQVKRMIHYLGANVTYLKRVKIGNFELPNNLELSHYMEISKEQLEKFIYKK